MALGNEGAPEDGTSTNHEAGKDGGFDFEQSYNALRPEYTRATQELASARERLSEFEALFDAVGDDSDPETQRAAIEALGLTVDTGTSTTDSSDWVDPLEEEVAGLRKWKSEVEAERELEAAWRADNELTEARDAYIDEALGYIEDNMKSQFGPNFKFKDSELEVIGNLAIAMEDDEGIPDVQGAFKRLVLDEDGFLETNRNRWIESKTNANMPPLGSTIPADKKPKTAAERTQYIDERVRALESQQ